MRTRVLSHPRRWFILLLSIMVCFAIPLLAPVAAQAPQIRLGELRVDWYCLQRGYGAWIINNGNEWACTNSAGALTLVLSQTDFNAACQGFYGKPSAYAVRDGINTSPALNWSCYMAIPPTPTPTFTPTPPMI